MQWTTVNYQNNYLMSLAFSNQLSTTVSWSCNSKLFILQWFYIVKYPKQIYRDPFWASIALQFFKNNLFQYLKILYRQFLKQKCHQKAFSVRLEICYATPWTQNVTIVQELCCLVMAFSIESFRTNTTRRKKSRGILNKLPRYNSQIALGQFEKMSQIACPKLP